MNVGLYRIGTLASGMTAYMDVIATSIWEALIRAICCKCFRDRWVRDLSPNRNVRVYIGAYAGPGNSETGYVPLSTLASILVQTRMSYPFFGGAVLWDASLAHGE